MSDLDDLGFTSISEMSEDEGIELLRQIRLSRRTQVKTSQTTTTRSKSKPKTNLTAEQAAALLKELTGDK